MRGRLRQRGLARPFGGRVKRTAEEIKIAKVPGRKGLHIVLISGTTAIVVAKFHGKQGVDEFQRWHQERTANLTEELMALPGVANDATTAEQIRAVLYG